MSASSMVLKARPALHNKKASLKTGQYKLNKFTFFLQRTKNEILFLLRQRV